MIRYLHHKYHTLFYSILFIYVFIYLSSIGDFVFATAYRTWSVNLLSSWTKMVFRQRSLWLFEPIAKITFPFNMAWLFSPINLFIGIILGGLVAMNIVIFWVAIRLPKQCRIKPMYSGFFASVLGLISGLTCCIPTFIIPLTTLIGVSASQFIIIRPWFIPSSIIILLLAFITTYRRIDYNNIKKF